MDRQRVKLSIRKQNLYSILLSKYLPAEQVNPMFSARELIGSSQENEILEVYRNLGGLQNAPIISFNVQLLEFGRFCVLLDEVLHFNRYRAKTLRASFYAQLSSFPLTKYRNYCRKYEVECLKTGTSQAYWSNDEAEAQFGPSQQSGDLGLTGSSGWKFTALKDLMIDMICRNRKIRLLRISVWDDLLFQKSLVKFNELLISPGRAESEQILSFVERKVVGLYVDDF